MTLSYQPLTELEAVNIILQAIGEQPVNSLDDEALSEASLARTTLHNVSRDLQSMGLHCNTSNKYTLAIDENGFVYVPDNTLKVDEVSRYKDVCIRGNRLYDRENNTYTFTEAVDVTLVQFLEWSELPQAVRALATVRAARQFQRKVMGDSNLDAITAIDEGQAWIEFKRTELSNEDLNLFRNPQYNRLLRR